MMSWSTLQGNGASTGRIAVARYPQPALLYGVHTLNDGLASFFMNGQVVNLRGQRFIR